jgi:hypothetical protein
MVTNFIASFFAVVTMAILGEGLGAKSYALPAGLLVFFLVAYIGRTIAGRRAKRGPWGDHPN